MGLRKGALLEMLTRATLHSARSRREDPHFGGALDAASPMEEPMQINLTLERETKNTVRFAEDEEGQPADHPGTRSWARSTSIRRPTPSSAPPAGSV